MLPDEYSQNAGSSLLDVLREQLGLRSVKDGCSPQGQCGCCTVLVDGQARVACVTPARRVAAMMYSKPLGEPRNCTFDMSNSTAFFVGHEIYDHLEKVVDRFDDVGNEISGIVVEHV